MTRIVLAITFPLRYYAYVTAPGRGAVAAAPLEPPTAAVERIAA
jgi:hypothetical protein